jgi:RNA polymerase sigma-70 factor, ECF subfamily
MDPESRGWIEQLRLGHPRRERAIASLHQVLWRAAVSELTRRRHRLRLVGGPEFDDLAQQAANDALVNILSKLDEFRGLSRFTTWAYKFVIFEVSASVARHAWRREPPGGEDFAWERLPDRIALGPGDKLEQRARFDALSQAIGELSKRQRQVFVAVALNDVPIDVLAIRLDTNRNAVYKNLFDARRRLRARLAALGYPVGDSAAWETASRGNGRARARAPGQPR